MTFRVIFAICKVKNKERYLQVECAIYFLTLQSIKMFAGLYSKYNYIH